MNVGSVSPLISRAGPLPTPHLPSNSTSVIRHIYFDIDRRTCGPLQYGQHAHDVPPGEADTPRAQSLAAVVAMLPAPKASPDYEGCNPEFRHQCNNCNGKNPKVLRGASAVVRPQKRRSASLVLFRLKAGLNLAFSLPDDRLSQVAEIIIRFSAQTRPLWRDRACHD